MNMMPWMENWSAGQLWLLYDMLLESNFTSNCQPGTVACIHALSCGLKTMIRQILKGYLITFCEIFTKITLELPQNSQKPLLKCKKPVINTTKCVFYVYFFVKCVVRWSENSVRF